MSKPRTAPPGLEPIEGERLRFTRDDTTVETVECVVCPSCAFTFDARHSDEGVEPERYTCPSCEVDALLADPDSQYRGEPVAVAPRYEGHTASKGRGR